MQKSNAARWFLLGVWLVLGCGAGAGQNVTIVANRQLSISTISKAQLHDIFTGARTRFVDGTHAVPVLLKSGPAHEVFLRRHLGETSDEF